MFEAIFRTASIRQVFELLSSNVFFVTTIDIEMLSGDRALDLESVVYREIADMGTENEHEYLYMLAGEGETAADLDVFSFEGGVTVVHDSDKSLREFREAIEAWYPVYRNGGAQFSDGERRRLRPSVHVPDSDILCFDYFFRDTGYGFDFSWDDASPAHPEDESMHEISLTVYYDNLENQVSGSLEPVEKIFPQLMASETGREERKQAVTDLIKYVKDVNNVEGYSAIRGCSTEVMEEIFDIENY